ncbi:putative transcription elongation factor S-II, central domain-containing protein [Helianthus debilis subsp. tardiflorus]
MLNNFPSHPSIISSWKMESVGSPKPLLPTKRKAATEPLSPSVVEKRAGQNEPHVNKRPSPLQPVLTKSGSQRVQTPKNKTAIYEVSPKVQSGSFEAVRSKMRETLAAALSVGIQNQEKPSNENDKSPSEAVKAHANIQSDDNVENRETTKGQNGKHDEQEPQYNYVMPDADGSFGDTFFVKDELLQGNGLSWAWDMEVTDSKEVNGAEQGQSGDLNVSENNVKSPEELASRIEAELFKLFGGVNKKYKEKGRSLMFNLKDPNNPELREKVLSGVISPERLCSMTPEELASKQLSEWRMAKAEEHDKMIVLQESDVDIRRLVKKTHKGEYQVEVEQDDAVSVEVSVGSTSFTQFQPKKKKTGQEVKEKEVTDVDKSKSGNITIPADGTDFMQDIIVDEFKDEGFLPPIVSLDEFMESLNSEPPFENLPGDDKETKPVNSDAVDETDSEKVSSEPASAGRVDQPIIKPNEAVSSTRTSDASVERKAVSVSSALIGEHVWEGELQLTISSSVSAVGLFRSGEKTSTKEWPGSMEIKGRVRLDAFEKFLQELPMSRTRAVMVVHFVLKDPSSEIHLAMLSEAVDSYIADERLGFGEPNPGVELYFCPPHTRIIEMLCKHLSKNQTDILKSTDNGLIGVVVWRRPHISFPNSSTSHQHKHHKKHNFPTRRNENINANNFTPKSVNRMPPQEPVNNDDDDDDIPPGFGPGAATAAARDEDDLPEFSFTGNSSGQKIPAQVGFGSKQTQSNPSRPVDQMRQLIYRYGQTVGGSDGTINKPWNKDEDDDMPEWQPHHHQNHHGPEVPPAHYMQQQQPVGPHMVNQIRPPIGQVMRPPMMVQPQVNVLQNVVRWPQPPGPHMLPPNAAVPGQFYDGQGRLDPRSRGF